MTTPAIGSCWTRTGMNMPNRRWVVTAVRDGKNGTPVVKLTPMFETTLGPIEWPVRATKHRAPFATAWTEHTTGATT